MGKKLRWTSEALEDIFKEALDLKRMEEPGTPILPAKGSIVEMLIKKIPPQYTYGGYAVVWTSAKGLEFTDALFEMVNWSINQFNNIPNFDNTKDFHIFVNQKEELDRFETPVAWIDNRRGVTVSVKFDSFFDIVHRYIKNAIEDNENGEIVILPKHSRGI